MYRKIKTKELLHFTVILLLILAVFAPYLKTGITLTDEVELRATSKIGYVYAVKHIIQSAIQQGRITNSLPFILFAIPSFFSSNTIIFRGCAVIVILINFYVFGYFVSRCLKKEKIGELVFILLVLFIPFSFEHSMPNGFVAFLVMPGTCLFVSLLFFLKYLESTKKRFIIISAILLFVALCSYELFIMFTPLYLVILISQRTDKNARVKSNILKLGVPFFTTILYLLCYVVQSKIFPSNYDGNKLADFSLVKTINVASQLIKTGIPGYYLFNDRYQYAFGIYTGFIQENQTTGVKFLNYFFSNIMDLRLAVIGICGAVSLYFCFLNIEKESICRYNTKNQYVKNDLLKKVSPILIIICMEIIIVIPNSISKMYQENVGSDKGFIALPVSYYEYLGIVILIAYLLYLFCHNSKKILIRIIIILITSFAMIVQCLGGVILDSYSKQYIKYTSVEKMLGTEVIENNITNQEVFAKDLYSILAQRPTYWEMTTKAFYQYNSHFNTNDDEDYLYRIEWPFQTYFVFITPTNCYAIFSEQITEPTLVELDEGNQYICESNSGYFDNGMYVCALE